MEILLVAVGFLGLLAWGDLLVARFWPHHSDHPLERALTGFGLLFGAGAFLIHALGFLGLLYRPLAYAVLLFCTFGMILWLSTRHRTQAIQGTDSSPISSLPLPTSLSDRLLLAGLCLFVVVNLVGCLTPEIRDDCLINHLSIPAGFANAHRIEIHPFNMNMGRPQLVHMYYILPLLFQNVFAAKLIHSMLALVGLAAMGWLAARTCEKGALWPSLYLFYSLPAVTLYATCSYIDLGRIYFEVWPLWLILRCSLDPCGRSVDESVERPQGPRLQVNGPTGRRTDLVLAAVIFGFGMGVHWLSAFFGWPVLTATLFFAVLMAGGAGRWKRAFLAAAGFGLLAAALFSPWILRNWLLMGNPSQALFQVPGGADEAQHLIPEMGGYLAAIRELPQRLYSAVWIISTSGNCPPILLLGALVMKFAFRDRDPRRTVMLVCALLYLFLFAVTLPAQDGRYILPGFAVSVVLFLHYVERLMAGHRQYRRYLVGGVLVLGLLNFVVTKETLYTTYGEPPWPVYSKAACERFLTQRFGDRTIITYLNEQLPPGSKVLLDYMVGPLYVWRPFMTRNYKDPLIFNTLLRLTDDNAALLRGLRGYGLTHVLVEGDFATNGLDNVQQARLQEFVRRHLRLVYQVGRQRLFEIVNQGTPARPPAFRLVRSKD